MRYNPPPFDNPRTHYLLKRRNVGTNFARKLHISPAPPLLELIYATETRCSQLPPPPLLVYSSDHTGRTHPIGGGMRRVALAAVALLRRREEEATLRVLHCKPGPAWRRSDARGEPAWGRNSARGSIFVCGARLSVSFEGTYWKKYATLVYTCN